MKRYKAIILTTISASLLLTSCGKSEEEKIINDLDLEIEEFLEKNPESDLNKVGDEKDEDEIKTIKKEELEENNKTEKVNENTKKNIKTVKTVEEFAQCITENGAKMFGTEWCGHCKKQKEMFGEALKYINLTDCDKNRKVCKDEGITGYPTWKISGKSFPGVQSFELLGEKTGCKLVK